MSLDIVQVPLRKTARVAVAVEGLEDMIEASRNGPPSWHSIGGLLSTDDSTESQTQRNEGGCLQLGAAVGEH